ncbi:MAG TPA: hypothetical protein P5080_03465 [Candidatus Paceibacterota bacterium]|nr:hypothetical protein [Candidatus Pacearchaeota archaeon]HRZ51097.1 hypothetical protein [Candidatus Paceibacterota bacterium]HSA36744.1 hypothetical protein [Candidatus Paceibacterota bacterium]
MDTMERLKHPFSFGNAGEKAGRLMMDFLAERDVVRAAEDFMKLFLIREKDLPEVMATFYRFADMTSTGGALALSADLVNEALYGYVFHAILAEYLGNKNADSGLMAAACGSWELAGACADALPEGSYVFSGPLKKPAFLEFTRSKIRWANVYLGRIESAKSGGDHDRITALE